MVAVFGSLALGGLTVGLVALAALMALGLHVTRKHPASYDPARNAKRYTRPALALVILAIVAFVGMLAGVIGAIVAAFTT